MLVYVVDDDNMHLENISEAFSRFSKKEKIDIKMFNIKTKYHVEEVEEEIIKNRPEIIISDQAMPYLDGSSLIERIREVYNPVTILNSAIPELHEHEFDFVVPKPTDLRRLVEVVEIVIESFELREMKQIEEIIDNFRLNPRDREKLKYILKAARELEKKNEKVTFDRIGALTYFHPRTVMNSCKRAIIDNNLNLKSKQFLNSLLKKSIDEFKQS